MAAVAGSSLPPALLPVWRTLSSTGAGSSSGRGANTRSDAATSFALADGAPRGCLLAGAAGALAGASATRGKRRRRRDQRSLFGLEFLRASGFGEQHDSPPGLALKDAQAAAIAKSAVQGKRKPRQPFNRDVLRDRSGKIIGGGDAPQPPGAEELFLWLSTRGCQDSQAMQLLVGGGAGVRASLEAPVPKESAMLTIPWGACLVVEDAEDETCTDSLVWRLAVERWSGQSSTYAPFVQWLSQKDVAMNPVMWDEEEVAWLQESPEGSTRVEEKRAEAEDRVQRLLQRCSGEDAALVPPHLADDREALVAELRRTAVLVQEQGMSLGLNGGKYMKVLCPLIGDIRNTSRPDQQSVTWQAGKDGMALFSSQHLLPGQELLQSIDLEASSAAMLANYGIVPGSELPGVPSDAELLDSNISSSVQLRMPSAKAATNLGNSYHDGKRLRLISKFVGLDLEEPRPVDTPEDRKCVTLPTDSFGTGRMLPLARFILADIGFDPSLDNHEELLNRYFVRFFQHCNLKAYPKINVPEGEERPVLGYGDDVEICARELATEWISTGITCRTEAIEKIATAHGLPIGDSRGVIDVSPGQVVMAFFKARRKDGSVGKSRKPRQARVVSKEATGVRVEYLDSGRRHEIPGEWVTEIRTATAAGLLTEGSSPERTARAKLAVTLLRAERAMLNTLKMAMERSTQWLEELLKTQRDAEDMLENSVEPTESQVKAWQKIVNKCTKLWEEFFLKEEKDLTPEQAELQLQRLCEVPEIPEVPEKFDKLPPKDPKRLWSLPPVEGFGDIEGEEEEETKYLAGADEGGSSGSSAT